MEAKDVIESVQVVEIQSGKQKRFSKEDCQFGYRDSIFKKELRGKVIVLNVTFRLLKVTESQSNKVTESQSDRVTGPQVHKATVPQSNKVAGSYFLKLDYGDIRSELQKSEVMDPTIVDVRAAVCNIRRRKLPDPAEVGNAGSFFKNPEVSKELLVSLQDGFPGIPFFAQANDKVKIPAAWLIEQCGWKGFRSGDVGVHPNQPLVLVNYGTATGRQVLDLANQIMDSVNQKFGIRLETEVNVID